MSTQARQSTAQIGGIPTIAVDVPVCAVLIAIFLPLAIAHMTILKRNHKRGHKFYFNYFAFGFAMTRVLALIFRLAWATRPRNVDISLVAAVFLNAGILIMYIINNNFAWRMIRSADPTLGWNRTLRRANKVLLWAVLGLFIPLIVILVLSVKKPGLHGIRTASKVTSRLAQTYFSIIAISSAVLLVIAVVKARKAWEAGLVPSPRERASLAAGDHEQEARGDGPHFATIDPFGEGSWNAKVVILALSIALATLEAGFRCGTAWAEAPPASDPAWWDHRAAFYCFNFGVDIIILILLLVGRIDKRFHIPNGADGPGSYSCNVTSANDAGSDVENKQEIGGRDA